MILVLFSRGLSPINYPLHSPGLVPTHTREVDVSEYPLDPLSSPEEGRDKLRSQGVTENQIDGLLHKWMAERLYQDELDQYAKISA